MGRMMGAFDPDDQLDRPDLNKCPDCCCYFAGENCPLCGKPCPEEMKAGNRKEVKPKKKKGGSGSGRVTFISWYHRWWFIILMALWNPIVGAILLLTSPRKKSVKIGVIAAVVGAWVILPLLFHGAFILIAEGLSKSPVNEDFTYEEYVTACREVSPAELYRDAELLKGEYLKVILVVEDLLVGYDSASSSSEPNTYYVCRDLSGGNFTILVRDCLVGGGPNYMPGDTLTVYGEGAGNRTVYTTTDDVRKSPCLNMAYANRNY